MKTKALQELVKRVGPLLAPNSGRNIINLLANGVKTRTPAVAVCAASNPTMLLAAWKSTNTSSDVYGAKGCRKSVELSSVTWAEIEFTIALHNSTSEVMDG